MQISGADYGPAVPSGVSLSPAGSRRAIIAAVIVPEPALTPDAIRAARDRDRPRLPRLAAVRPRRAVRAARRPGHRQGRDRQPDPLVQGPRDVGRRPGPGGGGEDRPRPPDRLRVGRQLRPGRRLRGPRARDPGRRVHLAPREPAQGRADARPRRRGHRGGGGLRHGPGRLGGVRRRAPGRAPRRRRRPADRGRRRRRSPRR